MDAEDPPPSLEIAETSCFDIKATIASNNSNCTSSWQRKVRNITLSLHPTILHYARRLVAVQQDALFRIFHQNSTGTLLTQ
jgi:hypothetical protein